MEALLLSKGVLMKTAWIMIDSFKKSYLKHTPFLEELSKTSFASLEPVPGYPQQAANMFTGMNSSSLNSWCSFIYNPKNSVFSWTKFLPSFFDSGILKNSILFLSFLSSNATALGKSKVPVKYLSYFDWNLKKSIVEKNSLPFPTVFDRLREKSISFSFIQGSISTSGKISPFLSLVKAPFSSDSKSIELAKNSKQDLLCLSLFELDSIAHSFGPNSKETKNHLNLLDSQLEELLKKFEGNIFINSDHGMVEVNNSIDLQKKLESSSLEFGKDYVFFLDSGLARFWFLNKKAELEIDSILSETKQGFVLSEQEKKYFGLDFKDNRFGDKFFLLKEGTMFAPNFFQKKEIKGMHGYLPSSEENGIAISSKKFKYSKAKLVDIAPSILSTLNISHKCSGTSLFS